MWKDIIPNLVFHYVEKLKKVNQELYTPKLQDILKAFRLLPFDACKVVILGQDPYPQKGVATGIAFANKEGSSPTSPSLEVIKSSVLSLAESKEKAKFDVTLESWEKQGILLLNSSLTVHVNMPGSHQKVWKPAMEELVTNMSEANPKLFWILFGASAWKFEDCIKNKSNNVLTEYHPAYFARKGIPMGNWMWKKMIEYVEQVFGKKLLLWDE